MTDTSYIVCPRCNGAMRVVDPYDDGTRDDGMTPCPEREGNGEIDTEQYADYMAWNSALDHGKR